MRISLPVSSTSRMKTWGGRAKSSRRALFGTSHRRPDMVDIGRSKKRKTKKEKRRIRRRFEMIRIPSSHSRLRKKREETGRGKYNRSRR